MANTALDMVLPLERSSKSSKLPREPSTSVPSPAKNQYAEKLAASGNASQLTERSLEVHGNWLHQLPSQPRPPSIVFADFKTLMPRTSEFKVTQTMI